MSFTKGNTVDPDAHQPKINAMNYVGVVTGGLSPALVSMHARTQRREGDLRNG